MNILFLMSDEHRADVAGFAGNRTVRTPTLDSLAESGVVFTNAYTPSPICVPGRQAMAAGKFPRHCGCERFGEDLAPGTTTFARQLAEYGYDTVCCGKLHHTGPDQMQGWTKRIGADTNVLHKNLGEQAVANRAQPPTQKWSDAKEIARAGIGEGPGQVADAYTVQGALNFLEEYYSSPYYDREQGLNPLLLKVSLRNPHYPYFTDHDRFVYYLNRVEPYLEDRPFDHPFLSQRAVKPGVDVSEREIRRATAAYYGMTEGIDELYGRILEKLEQVGQNLDDWLIIYTTDHGEMLGEHGIWEKQKFFEGSARVPLVMRAPRLFSGGREIAENVNLCDLFATLCDVAGAEIPEDLDSRTLMPLLRGERTAWDNETVSQFGARNLMIKQDALKYQSYGEQMPEVLFDLDRDPGETVNLIDDSAYAEAVSRFRRRRGELGF